MNQRNPFDQFLTETVALHKADGTLHQNIKASVQQRGIYIEDVNLRIEPGDMLVRKLANGLIEEYIVEEAHYNEALHGIPAGCTVKYHRNNRLPEDDPKHITYNVSGANPRINFHSHDYSTNLVQNAPPSVFSELRRAVTEAQGIANNERDILLERLESLTQANGTPGFLARYQEFITAAANHMTILAPFIPALTGLLGS